MTKPIHDKNGVRWERKIREGGRGLGRGSPVGRLEHPPGGWFSNLSHVHIYEPKCTQGVLVKLTKVGKGKDKLDGGR